MPPDSARRPAGARTAPLRPVVRALVRQLVRTDDLVHIVLDDVLRRRGWRPRVVAYPGYGADGWVRILGRVLLAPPGAARRDVEGIRGWRRFLTVPTAGVSVTVTVAGRRHRLVSGRRGYLDAVLPADLPAGPGDAVLLTDDAADTDETTAVLHIVGNATSPGGTGLISDLDDTVVVTSLPRPLLAFWNTFLRHEASRKPVTGMANLYAEVVRERPGTFVVYLSTGAWNVAPAVENFLRRHGFPPGPLLMTDWGPTADGGFRSGRAHKRTQIRRLLTELPRLRWLLVGDDGQHDPDLYDEVATGSPGAVIAVAIRQLTVAEQVLTHGTPDPLPRRHPAGSAVPEVRGPDGDALLAELRAIGVVGSPDPRQPE